MPHLPARFSAVVHPAQRLLGRVQAQPSKNYTARFLLAAALAEGESVVRGVATSEDAAALLRSLRAWGADIRLDGGDAHVHGFGAGPRPNALLEVGNAGAVARFLLATSALTTGTRVETDSPHSLGQRPMGDLLEALRALGLTVDSALGDHLPVTVSGGPVRGGSVSISAEQSSQFLSGLLFVAPLLQLGLDITVTGHIKSEGPIRQTLDTLQRFGVAFTASADLRRIQVAGKQRYQAGEYRIPGDYPGSLALLVAGAIVPTSEVTVAGLDPHDLQGERLALDVLRSMGAQLDRDSDVVTVRGGQPLRAVTYDGDPFTDAVQVLTAAATVAEGCTTWENVATLRLKECDRISDTRRELERLGLSADETPNSLSVCGGVVRGGLTANGHGDHRMIMLLSLLALRAESGPLTIAGAHHIRKSYPDFFKHLMQLGVRVEMIPDDAPQKES